MSVQTKPISKRELLAYQIDVKSSIFRQIRQMLARLKEKGFTQKELAERIDMDRGQLSRRLRGDYDLKLETLSDLARGLDCRIDVKLTPLSEVPVHTDDHTLSDDLKWILKEQSRRDKQAPPDPYLGPPGKRRPDSELVPQLGEAA